MGSLLPADKLDPISLVACHQLDPIEDSRWAELVERHPRASVFHTVGWLKALRMTYGYEPLAFTTSPPTGQLKNGMVFCRVNSWLTGHRLVSLPFADHCDPLCDSVEDLKFLIGHLQSAVEQRKWNRVEIRPINWALSQTDDALGFLPSATYLLHTLDLRPDLEHLFQGLDKDSVQRRIQRAERAGLVEKCGRSDDLLKEFYTLFVITRGRHGLPPTPYAWFRNLIQCQDKALEIRVAYQDMTPIAAILTLRFRDVVYFKYGCSDARFNKFGATPLLLWRAIVEAKATGAIAFDMGRTDQDDVGLVAFKNHWVPEPTQLVYRAFPKVSSLDAPNGWKLKMAKRIFSIMPDRLRIVTGRLLYPHIG
jgi:hypothetical protein